jgi:hypothetical protein
MCDPNPASRLAGCQYSNVICTQHQLFTSNARVSRGHFLCSCIPVVRYSVFLLHWLCASVPLVASLFLMASPRGSCLLKEWYVCLATSPDHLSRLQGVLAVPCREKGLLIDYTADVGSHTLLLVPFDMFIAVTHCFSLCKSRYFVRGIAQIIFLPQCALD